MVEQATQSQDGVSKTTPSLHIKPISSKDSARLIIAHHYSKRAANASFAFGLFNGENLVGAVTFGRPSSPQVARSVAPDHKDLVWELNRLVITTIEKNSASKLVGYALRLLPRPYICVSFADRGQKHVGFVYQATNFWFAGESRPHDSEYLIDGKRVHPRTLAARGITSPRQWAKENNIQFVPIEPKYRYVFLGGISEEAVKWPLSKKYPKGDPPRLNSLSGERVLPLRRGNKEGNNFARGSLARRLQLQASRQQLVRAVSATSIMSTDLGTKVTGTI